jgi:hypothetical protein
MMIVALGCDSSQAPGASARAKDEGVAVPAPLPEPAPPPAPAPEPPVPEVATPTRPAVAPSPIDESWKTHTDRRTKVAFRYPGNYLVRSTRTRANESALVLMQDDKFSRAYLNGKLKGEPMDGPMQITVWLRHAALEGTTLEAFVRNEVKGVGEGAFERLEVAGSNAIAYPTDGSWQGRTVVIERPKLLVQAHVDFNALEDPIRKDFEAIVSSMTW